MTLFQPTAQALRALTAIPGYLNHSDRNVALKTEGMFRLQSAHLHPSAPGACPEPAHIL